MKRKEIEKLAMQELTLPQVDCLENLLAALIDQERARVLVRPYRDESGFWFGGGNLVQDEDGDIWLSGRYRNSGDSRTGLEAGQRGLECAIFRSDDGGQSFSQAASWSKADLSRPDRPALSIEGTSLHRRSDGNWELFVSSEKDLTYPAPVTAFQKPGTGIWTIDRMTGPSPEALDPATLTPVLESLDRPEYLHVKDPVLFDGPAGEPVMIFCSHPYTWSCSNTGLARLRRGQERFQVESWEMVSRGATWDVAATRITGRLPVPRLGPFAGQSAGAVYFYDGAECVREHEQSARGVRRPRGYSCEEIGGAFFGWDAAFPRLERLSRLEPWFTSPWGTGCSRYAEALVTPEGILAVWQQSRPDLSQPLVGHFLPVAEIERIMAEK